LLGCLQSNVWLMGKLIREAQIVGSSLANIRTRSLVVMR